MTSNSQLSLTPLGAGDLIDRAIRFYRGNFWTFVWLAAPPILVGTLVSVGWTVLARQLFTTDLAGDPTESVIYYWLLAFGRTIIWLIEMIATLTVMGGASRNFVRHILFGEPVTFRETYKNVRTRFFGLLTASTIITLLLGVIALVVLVIGYIAAFLVVLLAIAALSFSPFLTVMISIALGLAIALGAGWLFFLIASHFAYVPQVMLVEGQGVFPAMGRSASLARGNVKRLYALFVFSLIATYSALMLLKAPLDLYAWSSGIDVFRFYFDFDAVPAWYEIASQFIWQASLILLAPVWMIGLCLLYVDERVRHEGYDIELMAARRLGEIPAVPREFINPLQPALAATARAQPSAPSAPARNASNSPFTTLGLK